MKGLYLFILMMCVPFMLFSQITAGSVKPKSSVYTPSLPAPMPVDTLLTPVIPFTPMAVSLHGYVKQLNDRNENFLLRNETHNYRISRVYLRLVYTTSDGQEIYRRDELIDCDLLPGAAQTIDIKSFDKAHNYYYYTTPPRRASGVPYRVKYDILRYDVVVE